MHYYLVMGSVIKSTYKYSLILVLSFLFSSTANAQGNGEDQDDFQTWFKAGIKYNINKTWGIGFESQLRLKENASIIDEYFGQLEVEYKVIKNVELGLGLRYIRNNDTKGKIQGYENHFRWNFDLSYKHKSGDFTFKHRLRYQNKNELQISSEEGDFAIQNIRFKSSIGYNIKKWKLDPKFSAELFNRFRKEDENGFSKYRLTLGTSYKLKHGRGKIDFFYRIERDLNETIPDTDHILGIGYVYTIKSSKANKG